MTQPRRIDWMFSTIEDVLSTARAHDDTVMGRNPLDEFLGWLGKAGELVLTDGMDDSPIDRADGFRNILIVLRIAMDRTLGAGDPYHPTFSQPWAPHLFDWGAAAPDCLYRTAPVRGDAAYRISGQFGNSPAQSLQVFAGQVAAGPHQTALDRPLDTSSLSIEPEQVLRDASGRFELFLGGPERDRNWFALHPAANTILSREFFSDPSSAVASTLSIECLDDRDDRWPITNADRVAHELRAIGEWVAVTMEHWFQRITRGVADHPNAFEAFHRTGTALPAMSFGFFDLAPDQALVIELPDPDTPYWGVQVATTWFRTLDFANRLTSFTGHQAAWDRGVFRAVLAHRDPGVANWLDTLGHRRGVVLLRIAHHANPRLPRTRVVAFDELSEALPPTTPRIDASARRHQIDERRRNVAQLLQR